MTAYVIGQKLIWMKGPKRVPTECTFRGYSGTKCALVELNSVVSSVYLRNLMVQL
jgi:hypothetical protein